MDNNDINLRVYREDFLEKHIGEICNNEYLFFLNKANVVGVALGYKYINNICTNEKCIAVMVEKKVSINLLSAIDVIPKLYKGIKTDVVETGRFFSPSVSGKSQFKNEASLKNKVRPVTGGSSISNVLDKFSGTMGCLVTDGNNKYMLSNNHILSNYNKYPIGSFICQPSIEDGGDPSTDVVAILSKSIPIKFITRFTKPANYVDCAIAKAINPVILSAAIEFIGIPEGIIIPRLGVGVKNVGRTTGLTSGLIQYLNLTVTIDSITEGYILYKDIIGASIIVEGGDSGALLLDANNYAVGHLIGGGPKYSIYSPIRTVLDALEVRLVTS